MKEKVSEFIFFMFLYNMVMIYIDFKMSIIFKNYKIKNIFYKYVYDLYL